MRNATRLPAQTNFFCLPPRRLITSGDVAKVAMESEETAVKNNAVDAPGSDKRSELPRRPIRFTANIIVTTHGSNVRRRLFLISIDSSKVYFRFSIVDLSSGDDSELHGNAPDAGALTFNLDALMECGPLTRGDLWEGAWAAHGSGKNFSRRKAATPGHSFWAALSFSTMR